MPDTDDLALARWEVATLTGRLRCLADERDAAVRDRDRSQELLRSVRASRSYRIGRALTDLAGKLSAIAEGKMDRRIFVRGDRALTYGRIMEVMATITQGGFTKVALLAEQAGAPAAPATPAPAATAPATPAPATPAPAPASRARGR